MSFTALTKSILIRRSFLSSAISWHKNMKMRIVILCLIYFFSSGDIFSDGENIAIKSVQVGNISVNTSIDIFEMISPEMKKIPDGLEFLKKTYSYKSEKEHTFWFYVKEVEMITIMRRGLEVDDKKTILNSLRRRSYFSDENTVLMLGNPPDTEKIFRMVFMRLAGLALNKITIPEENRNEWFSNGLAAYAGFRAQKEMQGITDPVSADDTMMEYYARFLNGDITEDIRSLESSDAWREALNKNPEKTYALSSLAVLYFVRNYTAEKAIAVYSMQSEKTFEDAFKEVTGDKAEKFYSSVEKKFYPEIKKISNKVRNTEL